MCVPGRKAHREGKSQGRAPHTRNILGRAENKEARVAASQRVKQRNKDKRDLVKPVALSRTSNFPSVSGKLPLGGVRAGSGALCFLVSTGQSKSRE